jgi:hypothetical protein
MRLSAVKISVDSGRHLTSDVLLVQQDWRNGTTHCEAKPERSRK